MFGGPFFPCPWSRNLQTFLSLNGFHWSSCGKKFKELSGVWPLFGRCLHCVFCVFRSPRSLPASLLVIGNREVQDFALLGKVGSLLGWFLCVWDRGRTFCFLQSHLEESQPFRERNWKGRVKNNLTFIRDLVFFTSLPLCVRWNNFLWKIVGCTALFLGRTGKCHTQKFQVSHRAACLDGLESNSPYIPGFLFGQGFLPSGKLDCESCSRNL